MAKIDSMDKTSIMITFKEVYLLQESYKEKISNYKFTDPFIKNFILRYENKIDWKNVKDAKHKKLQNKAGKLISPKDEINLQIKKLIQSLMEKGYGREEGYYSSEEDINWDRELQILKTEAENGNADAVQALQRWEQNPDESKKVILDNINSTKRNVFNEWSRYLTVGNEEYKQSPAFQYIMMKSILDRDKSKRNPPRPLNAAIVARIYEKIKDQPDTPFNVEKTYGNLYNEYLEVKNQVVEGIGGKWMKIPAKYEDEENYKNNVKDLMNMSYDSWCIRQTSFAENYLSQGPFWLYYVQDKKGNKHAQIALRFVRDQIKEIRGATRDQSVPDQLEPIIVEFIKKMEFQGGEGFVRKYYRKNRDHKVKKYIEDNREKLLTYYENNMSNDYCPEREFTESEDDDGEPIERDDDLKFWYLMGERDSPEQLYFDGIEEPDDFKKMSLLYGLLEKSNVGVGGRYGTRIGYDYVHLSPDVETLTELANNVKDDVLKFWLELREGRRDFDVEVSDIYHWDNYFKWIEKKHPELVKRVREYRELHDDLDIHDKSIFESISDMHKEEEGHDIFHSAEADGQRLGAESELYEAVQRGIENGFDEFTVEWDDEGGEDKIKITAGYDEIITMLLEDFDSISYQGEIINWDNWNKISEPNYYSGFDLESALEYIEQEFDPDVINDKLDEMFKEVEEWGKTEDDEENDKQLNESIQDIYLKELSR